MSESMLPAEADNGTETPTEIIDTQPESTQEVTQDATPEPEALILGKFKTNEDVQKSYSELEKRFGGFTGAPEEYTLPEEIDAESTIVSELKEYGKKYNMNQEAFEEMLAFGDQVLSANAEIKMEQEMEALGDNAQERIANVDGFLRNSLGDKYQDLAPAVNSAKVVELVESIIKSQVPAKVPTGATVPVNVPTQHDIDKLMSAKDEQGRTLMSTSESYREKVRSAIAQMHGIN